MQAIEEKMLIYLVGSTVFLSVIMVLVGLLLFVEGKVVQKGSNHVVINDDEDKSIDAPSGQTLLSADFCRRYVLPKLRLRNLATDRRQRAPVRADRVLRECREVDDRELHA